MSVKFNLARSMYAAFIVALLLTACAGPVVRAIGQTDIVGRVIDRDTGKPVLGACITATLAKGGFWTQPSVYLLGSACTDSSGAFRILANPSHVWNVADTDSHPSLAVSAPGYRDVGMGLGRDEYNAQVEIKLRPK